MAEVTQVSVQIFNRAGECVGSFTDASSFRKWRSQTQKQLGGEVAVGIGEVLIIDTPSLVKVLPGGSYDGVLLQKTPIPREARRKLSDCELWKAI